MTKDSFFRQFNQCVRLGNIAIFTRVIFAIVFSSTSFVFAQERPQTQRISDAVVYHGKLVRPDGRAVDGILTVSLKVYSPEPKHCLLWAETQTVTAKNGGFSLEIGYSENRGSGTSGGAAPSFRDVFLNNPGLTISNAECSTGSSYTPAANDDRLLSATFSDNGQVAVVENIPIKSVPFAKQAQEIGGYGIDHLMKISGSGSSSLVFSPEEASKLKDLSSKLPDSGIGSGKVLVVNATGAGLEYKSISAGTNVTITQTPGNILISASGGGGGGSGSVESVGVAGLPLSVVNSTTTPVVSIAQAGAAQAGYLNAADWTLFNNKLSTITGGMVYSALGFTPVDSSSAVIANAVLNGGNSGALTIGSNDSSTLTLETNNTSRLAIASTGEVDISSTSVSSNTSSGALTVAGGVGVAGNINAGGSVGAGVLRSQRSDSTVYSSVGSVAAPYLAGAPYYEGQNSSSTDGSGSFVAMRPTNSNSHQQRGYIGAISTAGAGNYTPAIVFGHQTGASSYAERMRIDSSGNVGIGTTSPSGSLHVTSTNDIYNEKENSSSAHGAGLVMQRTRSSGIINNGDHFGQIHFRGHDGTAFKSGALIRAQTDGSPASNNMPGQLSFWTTPDGSTSLQQRMTIKNNGNVGIGTTSPSSTLQVGTSFRTVSLGTAYYTTNPWNSGFLGINLSGGGNAYSSFNDGANNGAGMIFGNMAGSMMFSTFPSTGAMNQSITGADTMSAIRMTIAQSGNVGIGTTSPADKLHVEGKIRAQEICDTSGSNCKVISGGWIAGSVTSVGVAGLPLSVANGSTTPQLSIAQATSSAAGYLSSADWILFNSKQPAGAYLTSVAAADVATALGFTPLSPTLAPNQVLIGNGSSVAAAGFFGIGQMRNSAGVAQFPTACAASQTLTWSAVTDVLSCTNIGSLPASAISSGTIDSARLPFGASLWQDGGSSNIYYNSGRVGIGTTSPSVKLHVGSGGGLQVDSPGSSPSGSIVTIGSPQTSPGITIQRGDGSGAELKTWQMRVESDQAFNLQEKNVGASTGSSRFYVLPGGNIGIGTTTPSRKLTVFSDSTSGAGQLRLGYDDSNYWDFGRDNGVDGRLMFKENGTERITFKNGGNVGIGTTSPASPLEVAGLIHSTAGGIKFPDGTTQTSAAATGTYTAKTSNYTAVAGDFILADTNGGAFTITLPTTPPVGTQIRIVDARGTFDTNNLILAPNAADSIMGQTAGTTLDCDLKNVAFDIIYMGATYGWRIR